MTEGLTVEPGLSLRRRVGSAPHQARQRSRPTDLVRSPVLSEVPPGQVWFVEIAYMERALASLEYQALTSANVVIYDRALASTVGRFLPLGGYAEPATPSRPRCDAVWERCLRFAREGWSVARLVHPSREWVEEIRRLSRLLLGRDLPAHLPVSMFANLGSGVYEKSETPLGELETVIDLVEFAQPRILTIVCDFIRGGAAPYLSGASTNGLAG